jgi:hypothetical protein
MKLKLFALFFMLFLAYGNAKAQSFTHDAPTRSVYDHRKLQNKLTFDQWRNKQPRIRKKAVRAAKRQYKRIMRAHKKVDRIIEFENRNREKFKIN